MFVTVEQVVPGQIIHARADNLTIKVDSVQREPDHIDFGVPYKIYRIFGTLISPIFNPETNKIELKEEKSFSGTVSHKMVLILVQ